MRVLEGKNLKFTDGRLLTSTPGAATPSVRGIPPPTKRDDGRNRLPTGQPTPPRKASYHNDDTHPYMRDH